MKRFQSRGASTKIHDAGRGVGYMLISCRYTSFVKDSNGFILMMEKREFMASGFIAKLSTFKCFCLSPAGAYRTRRARITWKS